MGDLGHMLSTALPDSRCKGTLSLFVVLVLFLVLLSPAGPVDVVREFLFVSWCKEEAASVSFDHGADVLGSLAKCGHSSELTPALLLSQMVFATPPYTNSIATAPGLDIS